MKQISSLILPILLLSQLGACSRDGKFSTEGAYEVLRSIERSQNPDIEHPIGKEMDYREYERLRKDVEENGQDEGLQDCSDRALTNTQHPAPCLQ